MVKKPQHDIDSLLLLHHALGSVDLSDVEEEKEQTEAERAEYIAAISAVYPRLEKDIKRFLYAQLMFVSNNAETWEQVLFGRGTFNGMDVLLNYWKQAHIENAQKSRPEVTESPNSPIGEL